MEKQSLLLRRSIFLLVVLSIGVLHLFLATQVIRGSIAGQEERDNDKGSSLSNNSRHHPPTTLTLERNELLDAKPPTQIVVIGEIHSGAEFAASILQYAFGNDTRTHLHESIHRHDLLDDAELKDVASGTDILWVITIRSPCHWADAVIQSRKVDCTNEELSGGDYDCDAYTTASEDDYYRIPWHDMHQGRSIIGSIIKSRPEDKVRYDDIFDMRRRKLLLMKQIIDAMPRHSKILRLGEFELNPDAFVMDLVTEYNFKTREQYKPNLPAVDHPNQSSFSCLGSSKWKDAQQRIDWTLEGYFGHTRLDCHLCRHGAGQKHTTPIPSSIYLLGERNSGTTFVSNTLAKAFDPPNTMGNDAEKFASDIPVLLHKHMFRHDLLESKELAEISARDDILWIMVVRSPCEW